MCKILKHKQPTTKKSFKWFGHGNSIQTDHSFQTHYDYANLMYVFYSFQPELCICFNFT